MFALTAEVHQKAVADLEKAQAELLSQQSMIDALQVERAQVAEQATSRIGELERAVISLALAFTESEEAAVRGERFKTYVHERLDAAGVPLDPTPELTKISGCRIEGRLNWMLNEQQKLTEELKRATK